CFTFGFIRFAFNYFLCIICCFPTLYFCFTFVFVYSAFYFFFEIMTHCCSSYNMLSVCKLPPCVYVKQNINRLVSFFFHLFKKFVTGKTTNEPYLKGDLLFMGKRIAAVLTNLFEDSEYTEPTAAFKDAGHTVITIEKSEGAKVKGMKEGTEITIDERIDGVSV